MPGFVLACVENMAVTIKGYLHKILLQHSDWLMWLAASIPHVTVGITIMFSLLLRSQARQNCFFCLQEGRQVFTGVSVRYNDVCSTYADQPRWQDGRSCLAGKEWTWSYQEVGHFTVSFITELFFPGVMQHVHVLWYKRAG